jgi:hypothetical protein
MWRVFGVLQAMAFSSAALRLATVPSSSASRLLTLPTEPRVLLPPAELRRKLLPMPERSKDSQAHAIRAQCLQQRAYANNSLLFRGANTEVVFKTYSACTA